MKTTFIAAGPIEWGSSRLRCYWPAKYMNADVISFDEIRGYNFANTQAIILQKNGHPELQRQAHDHGIQVWWDCCDPVWWFSQGATKDILDGGLTGVVCSSQALADDFKRTTGHDSHVIPDRMDLEHYNRQREHGPADPVRLIWYGVAVNRYTLLGTWANLHRLIESGYNIELTLMDDMPTQPQVFGDEVPVTYRRWKLKDEVRTLTNHDIALLPPYPGPWGKVKSNNKTLTSWACGLPVLDGYDYDLLAKYVENHELRALTGRTNYQTLHDGGWLIENSVHQWEQLLWG